MTSGAVVELSSLRALTHRGRRASRLFERRTYEHF